MELRLDVVTRHIKEALARSSEPLCAYVYDLEALRRHVSALRRSLPPGYELFYAIKANSDLPILETLATLVDGFEVSSGGELAWVRRHFSEARAVFSGPGKTDAELRQALAQRVEAIHVESLNELKRLARIATESGYIAQVMLRVNLPRNGTKTTLVMGGQPTPFGIAADQLPACLAWLRRQPTLRLRGFHFHLLSHQLDAAEHLMLLRSYVSETMGWCRRYDLKVDHINAGGGIGINYRAPDKQFDWELFSSGLKQLNPPLCVRFEFGRYITAACGYYAAEVVDIKESFGRHYVVIRGGTHHFRTPYAQGHSHPFRVLPFQRWPFQYERPQVKSVTVTVVGQLCTPKDVLAFDAPVDAVRVGDVLIFSYAGAYAWHISHHDFLRHPHPQQWYLPVESTLELRGDAANQ